MLSDYTLTKSNRFRRTASSALTPDSVNSACTVASKPNGGRQKVVFHVESVKAVHDALKAKGLRLRPLKNLENGLACFDISDPESNKIQFWGNY